MTPYKSINRNGSPPSHGWKSQDCANPKWQKLPFCKCIAKCKHGNLACQVVPYIFLRQNLSSIKSLNQGSCNISTGNLQLDYVAPLNAIERSVSKPLAANPFKKAQQTLEKGQHILEKGPKPVEKAKQTLDKGQNILEKEPKPLKKGSKTLTDVPKPLAKVPKTLEKGQKTLGKDPKPVAKAPKPVAKSSKKGEKPSEKGSKSQFHRIESSAQTVSKTLEKLHTIERKKI